MLSEARPDHESEYAAMTHVAGRLGINAETLRQWQRRVEVDAGKRPGITTEDQAETDRLWNAIVDNGGLESDCGWCKDQWGVSWQITPRMLIESLADTDRARAKRVFDAMMTMKKIDIATLEKARRG